MLTQVEDGIIKDLCQSTGSKNFLDFIQSFEYLSTYTKVIYFKKSQTTEKSFDPGL